MKLFAKIQEFFPLVKQLATYRKSFLQGDIMAGLITAVLLIPQGMAYAMIAGLPPIYGLYASIIPVAVYAFFGTSAQLSVGPVAMVSLLVSASLKDLHLSPEHYIAHAVLLACMVGTIFIVMSLFKLGFLDNFLSHSVIKGFTIAAALIIGFSQLKHLTGIGLQAKHSFFLLVHECITRLTEINIPTFLIGAASIILLMIFKKIDNKIPGGLIVVILSILIVNHFKLTNMGVEVVGKIPSSLPSFCFPNVDFQRMQTLITASLTIIMVGFLESISVAKAIAARTRQKLDANRELFALGLSNLAGSFFGAYPVAGGFSRTAVNYEAGAKTGLASLITAGTIAITVIYFTPHLYHLPRATLAAIIMVAVFGLIDIKAVKKTFKIKKTDGYLILFTFIMTLTIGIEQGIVLGVIASLALFIWRIVNPHIAILGKIPGSDDIYRNVDRFETETLPFMGIIRLDAPLYFANARVLENRILDMFSDNPQMEYILLDAEGINDFDASAEESMVLLLENIRLQGSDMFITNAKGPVRDVIEASGFDKIIGEDHICDSIPLAVEKIKGIYEGKKAEGK